MSGEREPAVPREQHTKRSHPNHKPFVEAAGQVDGPRQGWRHHLTNWARRVFNSPRLFDGFLCAFTFLLAVVGVLQYCVLRATDEALHNSAAAADASNKLNAAGLRPWVSGSPFVAQPLSYDVNGARITIGFILQNTGHSPAQNTTVNVDAFPNMVDLGAERPKTCGKQTGPIGLPLFPGDKISASYVTYISNGLMNNTKILKSVYYRMHCLSVCRRCQISSFSIHSEPSNV